MNTVNRVVAGDDPGGRDGPWFDSHFHLQGDYGEQWDDPMDAIDDAHASGVVGGICVGTDLQSSRDASTLTANLWSRSGKFGLWYTVGVHPHNAGTWPEVADEIGSLVAGGAGGRRGHRAAELVAIGECGLDYHYGPPERAAQRDAFIAQIDLARRYDLSLVVHSRDAWDDTFAILDGTELPDRVIMHCFTGGPAELERSLAAGAYVSFSGVVTFKNAPEVQEAARRCPADHILVETDAPYLSPVPHRGKPNRPGWVALTGARVAALRGEDKASFCDTVLGNARRAFALE